MYALFKCVCRPYIKAYIEIVRLRESFAGVDPCINPVEENHISVGIDPCINPINR